LALSEPKGFFLLRGSWPDSRITPF
jgi:hypothetical protein